MTLAAALAEAIRDSELKELLFITPIALMASTAKRSSSATDYNDAGRRARGRGRGNGRCGRGRGRGRSKDRDTNSDAFASKTPDGRLVCFVCNNKKETCDGRCNMLHICRVRGCYAKHPMHEHPSS